MQYLMLCCNSLDRLWTIFSVVSLQRGGELRCCGSEWRVDTVSLPSEVWRWRFSRLSSYGVDGVDLPELYVVETMLLQKGLVLWFSMLQVAMSVKEKENKYEHKYIWQHCSSTVMKVHRVNELVNSVEKVQLEEQTWSWRDAAELVRGTSSWSSRS